MSGDEYILARIDIVAFSKMSRSDQGGEDVFRSAEEILSSSNENIRRLNASSKKDLKLETAKLYGDTIDIFFKTGDHDSTMIRMLFDVVAETQRKALDHGFFIKGAIVKGNMQINEGVFTGSAMVDANELEKNCPYSCVVIAESVLEIIDKTANEIFMADQDILDFKNNIIIDGLYLNYLEARPFDFWIGKTPELNTHKRSLISTISRYISILPDNIAEREKYTEMYDYAVKNHNTICGKCNNTDEKIDHHAFSFPVKK